MFRVSGAIVISTLIGCGVGVPFALAETTATTSAPVSVKPAIDPHNSADVEKRVREFFADVPAMVEVARCESKFRQSDDNGNVLFGGANRSMIGVFQIHSMHVPEALNMGMNPLTLEGNMAYARHLYEAEGMTPWASSKGCWGKVSVASSSLVGSITGLKVGTKSSNVVVLQQMLNRAGFAVAGSGPGSAGNETTKFGTQTRDAVRKFQCSKGIVCSGNESTTGYGLVGPRTYAALLAAAKKS